MSSYTCLVTISRFWLWYSFILFSLCTTYTLNAQELKVEKTSQNAVINIEELPEYLIIQSEDTRLLGGIAMTIDYKNSEYKEALIKLQGTLEKSSGLKVRNQTDLLNALSKLGFEYVDAYEASAFSSSTSDQSQDKSSSEYGSSKIRINMIFRKKEKFRNQ